MRRLSDAQLANIISVASLIVAVIALCLGYTGTASPSLLPLGLGSASTLWANLYRSFLSIPPTGRRIF